MVLVGPAPTGGAGFGASATVMTVQGNPSESGCVAPSQTASGLPILAGTAACNLYAAFNSALVYPGGDEKTGNSQVSNPTVGSLGIQTLGELGIIFNGNQPAAGAITIQALTLGIFRDTGSGYRLVYSASAGTVEPSPNNQPIQLTFTQSGQGNQGFLFAVDPSEQGFALQALDRIGLAATVGCPAGTPGTCFSTSGGADNFSAVFFVPEPSSLLIFGSGLAALAIMSLLRRRRAAARS